MQSSTYKSLLLISLGVPVYFLGKFAFKIYKTVSDESKPKKKKKFSEDLLREQFKRNYQFFGENGMKLIRKSFVVIVGLNEIGTNSAITLIRSGVKKLRIIDHKKLTRAHFKEHPFALLSDIGKKNVDLVKEYAMKINPTCIVEVYEEKFESKYGKELIEKDKPDYVIDCLFEEDDFDSKLELIHFCNQKFKFITVVPPPQNAYDPTLIRFGNLDLAKGEAAEYFKKSYSKKFKSGLPEVQAVFYTGEHKDVTKKVFRGGIFSVYSQILSSTVLCGISDFNDDAEKKDTSNSVVRGIPIEKIMKEFFKEETKQGTPKEVLDSITIEKLAEVAKAFDTKGSLTKKFSKKLKFNRFRPYVPLSIKNIILIPSPDLAKHQKISNEEELIKAYTKEKVEEVDKILNELK